MGTVVALASPGGVVIAADRQGVDEGTVTSQRVQRVVDFDSVGAGVVGETAAIQAFRQELEHELRQRRLEDDEKGDIDTLGRIAARLAERSNVAAVVAGHDADGIARLREIGPDGGVLEGEAFALGDGAELAIGQLEAVESELDLDALETTVVEILERVANRDAATGTDVDLWSLSHAPGSECSDEH